MIAVGMHNAITDVDGIRVGNCHDRTIRSGVTVILPDQPCVAAADIRGGAPGTRETDLLDPANTVKTIDALVFSGGSAFGLEAASGATSWLAGQGRGLAVRGVRIPIVPAAVIFDPPIGGPQDWHEDPPHRGMAIKACENAGRSVAQGNVGAGMGATAGPLKGGLGTASFLCDDGIQVGALAIANPFGSTVAPGSSTFWAAPYEMAGELGGQLMLGSIGLEAMPYDLPGEEGANTTLVAVATNLRLTRSQAKRVAIMVQDGLARAIRPVHSPFDGDSVFVLATGTISMEVTPPLLATVGLLAADATARAIAKGVYNAETLGGFASYREMFGK
ncbi:MAG: P1 family peptidase [Alphaproteobacteria bacterium]|nr:P1 family peptidase [Alphaproteobacteria bacterium]